MNSTKIAPELLLAFQEYEDRQTDWDLNSMTLDIQSDVDSPESARVNVFLECDESAELDHLEEIGVKLNTQEGRIRTASLPLGKLDRLVEESDIRYVEASQPLHLLMDVAPGVVQIPEFQNRTELTGEGVIIGIVDTGIDATHPAFDERILQIWDQILDKQLTGADLTGSQDTNGHGTHVAGIAAGSNATFGGVAPGSELVIVKTTKQAADIAKGIRHIFGVADTLNRPAVVNISLGGHYDPHDGSDGLSKTIDRLSGEGRIVCCAAGNEGNYNIHAQAPFSQNKDLHSIKFFVPNTSDENSISQVFLSGWYSGRKRIEIAVQSPSKARTGYQDIIPGGIDNYNLPDARIHIVTGIDRRNQDFQFLIRLEARPDSDRVAEGKWKFLLRGRNIEKGLVDVWVLDGKKPPQVSFTGRSVSDALKIGSPGAARRAITVASYTTKVEWQDIDGNRWTAPLTLDDISDFSSEGPLRNGYQKPDVAAPGAFIASCLSSTANPPPGQQINSHYTVRAGTSMSAPFISGIIALLLQHDPTLTPERIKTLLQASSFIHRNRPGRFHPKWGHGLINAEALADALASFTS